MLSDFFRINLPYGIARNENGEWMAFNREYRPIGYNENSEKGMPGNSYQDLPVYTKYKKIPEKLLIELACKDDGIKDDGIRRNEKGEIIRIFLYCDGTNPRNQQKEKKELWNDYFAKLKKLSKLEV